MMFVREMSAGGRRTTVLWC